MKHYLDIHKLDDIKCDGWNGTTGIKSLSSEGLYLSSYNGWESYGWKIPQDAIGKNIRFEFEYKMTDLSDSNDTFVAIFNDINVYYHENKYIPKNISWTQEYYEVSNSKEYVGIMLRGTDNGGKTLTICLRNMRVIYGNNSAQFLKNGVIKCSPLEISEDVKIDKHNIEVMSNLFNETNVEKNNNSYLIGQYVFDGNRNVGLITGQKYTCTICITPAAGLSRLSLYFSQGYVSPCSLYVNGTQKQIVSTTFTMGNYSSGRTPTDNASNSNAQFYRFPNDGTITSNSILHWVKIENGSYSTMWTPSNSEGFTYFVENSPIQCNEIKEI